MADPDTGLCSSGFRSAGHRRCVVFDRCQCHRASSAGCVREGFWGQVWPKFGRKPAHKSEFIIANEPLSKTYSTTVLKPVWALGVELRPTPSRRRDGRSPRSGNRRWHDPPKSLARHPAEVLGPRTYQHLLKHIKNLLNLAVHWRE